MSYKETRAACQKILELKGLESEVVGPFRDEVGHALLNLTKALEADLTRISYELAQLRKGNLGAKESAMGDSKAND